MRVGRLALLLIGYLPLHYAWRVVGARSPWPPRFLGAAARACGVRLTIRGTPLKRDVFIVSNHSSWLDILILGGATRAAFVSKAELATAPLVGWLADLNRTIYIKREDRRAIPAQLDAIRTAMTNGPVAIFRRARPATGRCCCRSRRRCYRCSTRRRRGCTSSRCSSTMAPPPPKSPGDRRMATRTRCACSVGRGISR